MIQRKQTLWFLLSALMACLAFVLPFGFKNTTSLTGYNIDVHDFSGLSNLILTVLLAAIILLNLLAVFLFKNRNLQVTLGIFAALIAAGALAYEIYFCTIDGNSITFGIAHSTLYIGLLFPLISLMFTLMAVSGVKSDMKLLKESSRLR
jgi:hypothetical protein